MLASLLPGVRQLRAPLAAGFVWLVVLWFAVAADAPPADRATGVLAELYRLLELAGPAGASAAAAFTAYLLGILSMAVSTGLLRVVLRRGTRSDTLLPPPSRRGRSDLADVVLRQWELRSRVDPELRSVLRETTVVVCGTDDDSADESGRRRSIDIRVDVPGYVDRLVADLQLIPLRMLGDAAEQETYAEFDRKRAEGEFRMTVTLPLAVLVVVVAVRESAWWLLALVLPVAVLLDGYRSAVAAADVLAAFVRARVGHAGADPDRAADPLGTAFSPVVDEIRAVPLTEGSGWEREDWVREAALRRHVPAMMRLAEQSDDPAEAERWYRTAADEGNPTAMMWLAKRLHRRGDRRRADDWYRRAAREGDAEACTIERLRSELRSADLVAVKSAYAGDTEAMVRAARALLPLTDAGFPETVETWLRTANAAGDREANRLLVGLLRERGHHTAAGVIEQA